MQCNYCKFIEVFNMAQKIKQDIHIGDNIRSLRRQAGLTQDIVNNESCVGLLTRN